MIQSLSILHCLMYSEVLPLHRRGLKVQRNKRVWFRTGTGVYCPIQGYKEILGTARNQPQFKPGAYGLEHPHLLEAGSELALIPGLVDSLTWRLGLGAGVSETNLFLGLDLAKRLCLAYELGLMFQITWEIIFHHVITLQYEDNLHL